MYISYTLIIKLVKPHYRLRYYPSCMLSMGPGIQGLTCVDKSDWPGYLPRSLLLDVLDKSC